MTTNLRNVFLSFLSSRKHHFVLLSIFNLILGLGMGCLGWVFSRDTESSWLFAALGLLGIVSLRVITSIYADKQSIEILSLARKWLAKTIFSNVENKLIRFSKSELLERLTTDTYNFFDAFIQMLIWGTSHLLLLLISLIFLIQLAPEGLLIVFFGVSIYAILSVLMRARIQSQTLQARNLTTKLFTIEKNFIDGHEYLKTSNYFNTYMKYYHLVLDHWTANEHSKLKTLNVNDSLSWTIKILFVLLLAGSSAQYFDLDPMSFYWVFISIGALSQVYSSITQAYIAYPCFQRSLELLHTDKGPTASVYTSAQLALKAKNLVVFFDPKGNSQAAAGPLNFALESGTYLWLGGKSGAGKTTLIKCLVGLHCNYTGQLVFPSHRYQIAYVEQDPFLFEGEPLWVNLGLSQKETPDQETLKALGLSHFFSHLHLGMETLIGPENLSPSKGEARRLAILRAIMQKPDVLILDEPTAGLEPDLAENILKFIRENMRNKILVVADHRQNIIKSSHPTSTLQLH